MQGEVAGGENKAAMLVRKGEKQPAAFPFRIHLVEAPRFTRTP